VVKEEAHKIDGRGKIICITNSGRELRKNMWKVYGPLIHEHVSKVSVGNDPATLAQALEIMIDPSERR